MTTKLSLKQAKRFLSSMDYYLADASVWTPEAIIEEAEIILEAASTDADFEYQIIDDGDGPIAIFNGIPGEVLDALNEDGYYAVNITEIKVIETNNNSTKTGNDEPAKEENMTLATIKAAEVLISNAATFTKTSDPKYVNKNMLGVTIKALSDALQVEHKLNNRMSRPELITELKRLVDEHNVSRERQIQTTEENKAQASETIQKEVIVPVGDLEITKDKMVVDYIVPEVKPAPSPTEKTNKLLSLIKANAEANNKKGYGYTISSFMLQACILNAGAGIEKLKGHTVTAEEDALTQTVYKWLLKKELIKPIIYSVKEDENVRIYMPEYTGRKDSIKTKLIPYAKSMGYTAKKVTSFAVKIK